MSIFDEFPSEEEGFVFSEALSEKEEVNGTDAHILGSKIHPSEREKFEKNTISPELVGNPQRINNYRQGQVVAINNPFKNGEEEDKLHLYIISKPYKAINKQDVWKYKLIPIDPSSKYVRVYSGSESKETSLLTPNGKAEPTYLFPVPDAIIADECGNSEEIVKLEL